VSSGSPSAVKGLPKNASLSEVTTSFLADNYRVGYAMDSKSPSWNELNPQERKSLHNKFGSIKRAVKMVLLHADSYPLIPSNPSQYKSNIRAIANAAEKRICDALGLEEDTISVYKLEKQLKLPHLKDLEKTLKLPSNTPEEMKKFFKSD
jgi:hypothetical protein